MGYVTKGKVYSQVWSILNLLGKEYIDKLPSELYQMIGENRDKSYLPSYEVDVDINEQNISKQALAMITLFNIKYWSTEEERASILKVLNENEEKYQSDLEKMYDFSLLREENVKSNEPKEEVTVYKENLFTKILNRLKSLFKKKGSK